ncbi:MAG: Fe-S metabolism protein SufE [Gammaproteobacteria bacterium (ex Lamellibrachia satsuma)]|nr:MAG: SufE family protein [Gammaproteobacteria bacterium (ex Lamellibrachia satsuma)]RRS33618.1 MAG: Fe-S metabolism protein SufE [Gammaproteobacteria bacterium (ex Lamellibrachia satsuma)]RRS34815.1 MAG: Fe-S metabolism protein SufE [Gammaproteobacteria bacterium (ex Lamellibrachia satsuma)]
MNEIDEIVDNFEFLDDWEQRYQYLVELGEALPPLPDRFKTEENWVKPCMSTVHVYAEVIPGQMGLIRFRGDCDTAIIKGVLAVLVDLLSSHTLEEIRAMDVDDLFKRLHLAEHLSPNRHVGIYAIVNKMVERAEALADLNASNVA